ncbi:MAG: DEAD/DEAH box helicase [Nonlabens sp.]
MANTTTFTDFKLLSELQNKLKADGFTKPTPIQEATLPAALDERDILGIAKTGSGKTLSYALPLLNNLKDTVAKHRSISGLILVPTRELAVQVGKVVVSYSKSLPRPLITRIITGGNSINTQMQELGNAEIVVATPGRLIDLIESNAVHINEVKCFVLDEADKMLALGFREELDAILYHLPKKKQSLLFSATWDGAVTDYQDRLLNNPTVIKIEEPEQDYSQIKLVGYRVADHKKGVLLRHLIESHDMKQVLIFCSSTYQVEHVNDKLNTNGIKSKAIHGKKKQSVRNKNLEDFKNGTETGVRCLVTTDLLSRGIDIEFLPYVINYELPRSPKDFIHRIGRTGRADQFGTAISLVVKEESHHMRTIQKKTGLKVWMEDLPEWNS